MTTVKKDILSKAIGTVAKAVGANPVIPLLSNILFESNNGSSRVAGTDLEIGIGYTFPSSGKEFKTCIPAKTITGLVDTLDTNEVDLELDDNNQSIMVMTESSTSNIRCAPADEFPDILSVTNASFSVPVVSFKEMIQRVAFASAVDDIRGVLVGVQLSIDNGKLIMFATDGFHMSYEEVRLIHEGETENLPCIIKGTTLETISRILPDEGEVEIQVKQNKAMFHCGNVDIVTQLMTGNFPDYKMIRQSIGTPGTTLIIPTREFMRATKQLRVFASEAGNSKLEAKGMLMRYSTVTQEKGDADINFAAIKKGSDITVGINVHLLYDFLEVCKTEYIILETVDNRSPLVFKMQGFESFYHVIMPLTP